MVTRTAAEHINSTVRSLAARHFGPEGKLWREQSRSDDTFGMMFSDDQGRWPGRGDGRFTSIPDLLRKTKGMPEHLPEFLRALHKALGTFMTEHSDDLRGTNKISIRWRDNDGEDEEWSIALGDEYPQDKTATMTNYSYDRRIASTRFELVYQTGGTGGPYENEAKAKDAAERRIKGGPDRWIAVINSKDTANLTRAKALWILNRDGDWEKGPKPLPNVRPMEHTWENSR